MSTAPPAWHASHWQRLQQALEHQRMPHALLLLGQGGLGKRAFAQRLVARLLCRAPQAGEACGQCHGCRLRLAETHPDLYRLGLAPNREGKLRSEIVIDQVRAVCEKLTLASQLGGWRVALIDPADALNAAAYNALLKTLEEPPAAALLILLADHPERLPATVRSRCQRVQFQVPVRVEARSWLDAQGLRGDSALALDAAEGNPGLAAVYLREGALPRREAVRSELAQLLAQRADALALAQSWSQDNPAQRLLFAAQWLARELRAHSTGMRGPLAAARTPLQLAQWFEQANRARELLRGPLRSDLVLLDFLSLRNA
ncbi:DNA polymerase III subunit delta' [Metallibacterium sp.]|jgi:DNA polymerase-3 subunit delta'|uniref:DNA polymerase III subunit delta' n=1 Tax=Metallibacterium sp. TaxID=2940281 RepID=UPI0026349B75|nr:DNA polymerase III subunit delta' [Metallibacterium sp.]